MRTVKIAIATAAAALIGVALAAHHAQAAGSSKEAKVRELLQLTGAEEMGNQILDATLAQLGPSLPAGYAAKFKELAQKDKMTDRLVPIYLKHLDEKDIDGAIAFYKSPAGKDFVKAQPQIFQESMQVGQAWGKDIGDRTDAALGMKDPALS